MSAFSNSRSPDNSGRGGFLLCQRDPTTVFQGEFNRLAKSALDAQNAHIEKVKLTVTLFTIPVDLQNSIIGVGSC